jgi:hypothetical protein
MSAELNDDREADDSTPAPAGEPVKASGNFVFTDRMKAIARGEDPDATSTEPEVEEVAEVEPEVDKTPEQVETQPVSWITDSDRAKARSYGMEPEDLDAYENREQFGSALRAIDRAYSRLPVQEEAEPEAKVEDVDTSDQKIVNGKINPAYFEKRKDEYDEDMILAMQRQRALEDKLEAIESQNSEATKRAEQEQAQRALAEFHREVDRFRPDAYGSSVDANGQVLPLKSADADRRFKLLSACATYTQSVHDSQTRAGLPPSTPPLSEILKHAEYIAFPDEVQARIKAEAIKEREAELKKIAKQAQRVRPVATTASAQAAYRGAPHEDPHSTEAFLRSPQFQAFKDRVASQSNH